MSNLPYGIQEDLQCRKMFIRGYATEDKLVSLLNLKLDKIKSYAYIYHDNDTLDTGKIGKKHYHLYLELYGKRLLSSVGNWFASLPSDVGADNIRIEKVRSVLMCLRYLIHIDDEDKYQYDSSLVKSYRIDYEKQICCSSSTDGTYDILKDYLTGTPVIELVRKYGREFLYHYPSYKLVAQDVIETKTYERIKEFRSACEEDFKEIRDYYGLQMSVEDIEK